MGTAIRIVSVAALLGIAAYLSQPYRPLIVQGQSMEPTFGDGQVTFWRPVDRPLRDGDIVLLRYEGVQMVKRISMVEGDSYFEAFYTFSQKWLPLRSPQQRRVAKKRNFMIRRLTMPKGYIYVLGDNSGHSQDSDSFGPIPVSSVVGIVSPT